jgi:hypothetical protein
MHQRRGGARRFYAAALASPGPRAYKSWPEGRMNRLAALLLGLVLVFVAATGLTQERYYYYDDRESLNRRPRKLINLKAGLGYDLLYKREGGRLCETGDHVTGQLGISAGMFPWTAEINFYTDIAVEVYGGFFYPAFQLGRGWLAFSAGILARTASQDMLPSWAANCAIDTDTEFAESMGIGATIEYLMYTGHLGFYLEVKQAVIEPLGTTVTAGLSVSPLLYLLFKNN